jgi:hypothetical protein
VASPEHRQLHVLDRVQRRDQVVELEDEADDRRPVAGAVLGPERQAGDRDLPGRRPVEGTDQVQQGALAAARRPGDGNELALLDAEGDIHERRNPPLLERPRDMLGDDRGAALPRAQFPLRRRQSRHLHSLVTSVKPTVTVS